MPLEDRHTWPVKRRGPDWFQVVIDDLYNTLTQVQPIPANGIDISETTNGRQISATAGGAGGGGGAGNNHYEFEAIDWSDEEGAKVLIYDGFVYGPHDDGNYPDGMTGLDDFVAGPLNSGDSEVWLEIWVDFDSWTVTSININWGAETPPDNDTTIFVTICFVGVAWNDASPPVSHVTDISNAICGDYVIDPGLGVLGDDPLTGEDFEMDHVTQINFQGACTVEHDPADPDESSVDVTIGLDVVGSDDEGVETSVDKVEVMHFYGGVDIGENTDDPDVKAVDVEIGLDLTGDDGFGVDVAVDKVAVLNLEGAVRLVNTTVSGEDFNSANAVFGIYVDDGGDVDQYDDIWGLRFPGGTLHLVEPGFLSVVASGSITAEWDNPDGTVHSQPGVAKLGFWGAVDAVVDSGDASDVDLTFGTDIEYAGPTGDAAIDKVMVMGFWGAVDVSQDTSDPDVTDVDFTFGEDLTGDNGFGVDVAIDKVEVMNFIGAVRLSEDTSDPDVKAANITVGVFVDDGGGIDEYDDIWGLQFPGADLTLIEPGYLKIEAGGVDTETDDTGAVDNVKVLGFWGAVEASLDTSGGFNDLDLTFGLDIEGTNDAGTEIAIDKVMVLGFWGACVLDQDLSDPDVIDVDITFGEDITGDDGSGGETSVDKVEVMNFTGAVRVANTSTADTKSVDIVAGMYIADSDGEEFEDIWGLTFEGAQLTLLEPGHLEVGGLNPVFDVQGSDGSYVASVGLITFKVASDPSANYITVYNGPGTPGVNEAVIEIPLIPDSIGGKAVLFDDDGDTHWQPTVACECSTGGVDGGGV